jgi:Tfp pilus assembly protein PilN
LWFSESRLRQRALELQPLADEHDLLEVKIQKERKVLKRAVETNQAMARAMANVRSSSALLAELQRLVPQTIRLDQARISGNALELNGEALMPDGLRTLNALMLSLGQSALFDEDGVTLQQASLKGFAATGSADQERLSYALSARFASDAPQAIRPQLAALGAIGLKRRLQRLDQEEGLFE